MAKRRRTPAKPELYPRIPVGDFERVRDRKGSRIRLGQVVRRRTQWSDALELQMETTAPGRVVRMYRRSPDGPVLVDYREANGNLRTYRADRLSRSQAFIEDEATLQAAIDKGSAAARKRGEE